MILSDLLSNIFDTVRSSQGTLIDTTKKLIDTDQKWAVGFPSGFLPAVIMTDGEWKDALNTTLVTTVICTRTGPYEWHKATGKFYAFNTTKVNQSMASSQCAADGGQMAVTYCPEGLQVLQHYSAEYGSFFIGGTDAAMEGTWVFPDGEEKGFFFEIMSMFVDAFVLQEPACKETIQKQRPWSRG